MAITYKYGMNAALPYNTENNMESYAITIASSNAFFLNEAPLVRRFHILERSALYFLCINIELNLILIYDSYDANNNILQSLNVSLNGKLSFFNAVPVNSNFIHPNATMLTVRIINIADQIKTETRVFHIDRSNICEYKQLVWLNKLGGYDTFMFEAAKTFNSSIATETPFISADNKFFAPNRINSFLTKEVKHGYKVSTIAASREEYKWLTSAIAESVDVYTLQDDFYIPINVNSSGYTLETFNKDLIVTIDYKNAFLTNIQTR